MSQLLELCQDAGAHLHPQWINQNVFNFSSPTCRKGSCKKFKSAGIISAISHLFIQYNTTISMYSCICTDHVCLGPTLYLSLANVDKCLAAPGRKGGLDAACSCQLVSMLSLTFPTKLRFPRSLEMPNWQHDCRLYNLIIICSYALFWKLNQYFVSHVFSAQIMWTLEYRSGNFCCCFFFSTRDIHS